jgi:hypothetical protein
MATFKVGQRVKMIDGAYRYVACGAEGTVTIFPHALDDEVCVTTDQRFYDELGNHSCSWYFRPHQLAPLTDPKADAFIE